MKRLVLSSTLVLATVLANPPAVHAQAVVQPLPPPAVSELNSALRRLAANSRNLDALLDAGYASLKLDDVEAAIGFFGRAQELSPNNSRVKAGLAAAFVRSGRPIDALRLFDEAEQAGASTLSLAADRGLAYDLVGDNSAAQGQYARALNGPDGDRVRLRLALSQAIAGDRSAFETTLYPLIEKRDPAAYRTRAFAMAILGEEDEAVAITEAVMPPDLAARIAPYLRYMRRLTPAQQAAAANLGNFPRAAQIGRDAPQIAAYQSSSAAVRAADASLAPTGTPLGASTTSQQSANPGRRRPGEAAGSSVPSNESARSRIVRAQQRAARENASDPLRRTRTPPPVRVVEVPRTEVKQPAAEPINSAPPPPPPPPPAQVVAELSEERAEQTDQVSQTTTDGGARPGFDLEEVAAPVSSDSVQTRSEPVVQEAPASVADAFSGFTLPPSQSASTGNAVDITQIEPPREVEEKAPPPPPPPQHPSRHWVQVATGKDLSALKFDWRRISRKAPDLLGGYEPHTTPWGVSNRLLAGPYDSSRAAREAVGALKSEGIDSFTFTSSAGQEILPLD